MSDNTVSEIVLFDGTKIKVRPLKISFLREFMKKFEEIIAVEEDNDKSLAILVDCVQIALKQYSPEMAEDRQSLEDNLDLPTVYKIIEAASGAKLADTNGLLNTVLASGK